MNILKEIVQNKKKEISSLKSSSFLDALPTSKDFVYAIKRREGEGVSLISEFKRQSPSKGRLKANIHVEDILPIYNRYASAISILTDTSYFAGSTSDLCRAREITDKPLLRKDFIIDPIQVQESRFHGADAFLLIKNILTSSQLKELLDAGREYNMSALVEVHTIEELEDVLSLGVTIDILGVNNRNLKDLSIDLQQTFRILEYIPAELQESLCLISESGFSKYEDVKRLPKEVDAILVGTSLMSSENLEKAIQSLLGL